MTATCKASTTLLIHYWDLPCGATEAIAVSDSWTHVTCDRCWGSLWEAIERTPEPAGCCECACWDCPYEEKRNVKPGLTGKVVGVVEAHTGYHINVRVNLPNQEEPEAFPLAADEEQASKWKVGDRFRLQMIREPRTK